MVLAEIHLVNYRSIIEFNENDIVFIGRFLMIII